MMKSAMEHTKGLYGPDEGFYGIRVTGNDFGTVEFGEGGQITSDPPMEFHAYYYISGEARPRYNRAQSNLATGI